VSSFISRSPRLQHCIHRELVNCRFLFQKRSQQFICVNNEAFSVAMCICNPDRIRPIGCVICQRLSACLAIDLPQQPTSRLPQAQPPKPG
jgi:hypothetical protein